MKLSLSFLLVLVISFSLPVSLVFAQSNADPFPNVGNFQNINNVGSNSNSLNSSCRGIDDFPGLVGCFTSMINLLVPLIIGLAMLVFIWGLIKYITAGGDDKSTAEARKFMLFGIIALFVMVSVWGLVGILVNTFFSGGVAVPQLK